MALGITGPILRATGYPWDARKEMPYCGYERYEFEVPTQTTADAYGRFLIRLEEMQQSLNIVEQALDYLRPGPVMVDDPKVAWPAQLAIGSDGMGNSLDHIRQIMGTSMEALIHHFKLVTEGYSVPVGPGLPGARGPAWRAGRARGLARWDQALPRALPRSQLQQPAVGGRHVRGRPGG